MTITIGRLQQKHYAILPEAVKLSYKFFIMATV